MALLPQNTNPPESLAEIVDRLNKYENFAYDFAETVKSANGGKYDLAAAH